MSISDRLDQIEQRGVRAASLSTEDWTTPECLFLVENELPELVAALRAVLDLCEKTPLRYQTPMRDEPFMVLGTEVVLYEIATALGEDM